MAKKNKPQAQASTTPNRKRDRVREFFKFGRAGSKSPAPSYASSASTGTEFQGTTAMGPGAHPSASPSAQPQDGMVTTRLPFKVLIIFLQFL
ncbi:hypothetical protein GYMLUDRAFT_927107 [Collybiopsis luxurians FD-317 M1]|uniref:Uncharacterized protein n=1 Tax=Collybiopsis luxurians FD-317 M1 TaxID=944289 RepID=A0A0D0BVB6_9AGAR|nr:hypothetical protein GYMLUDRAFT_927107 [Collybiopsis luxurians FD-317 M1]